MKRSKFYGPLTFALAALAVSCGPPPQEDHPPPLGAIRSLPTGSFAGRLADNDTFLAVVMDGESIRAYACSSTSDAWFSGRALRLPTLLTSADGTELYLRQTDEGLSGSLRRAGGAPQALRAPRTRESALFRAEDNVAGDRYLGGWIVLPDGQQRGGVNEGPTFRASQLVDGRPVAAAARRAVSFLAPARFEPAALQARTPNNMRFSIVGIGDSYASGEGAPEVNGTHDESGNASDPSQRETWDQRAKERSAAPGYVPPNYTTAPVGLRPTEEDLAIACHRSGRNGTRVAARRLADDWDQAVVNVESFACSGAKIPHLVSEDYRGPDGPDQERLGPYANRPQVEQVAEMLRAAPTAERRIDAMTVGVGGNDLNFASIIQACLVDRDCTDLHVAPGADGAPITLIERGIHGVPAVGALPGVPSLAEKYRLLGEAIDGLRAVPRGAVYLVDAPNMVRRRVPGTLPPRSEVCPAVDVLGPVRNPIGFAVSGDEAAFIDGHVIPTFRARMLAAIEAQPVGQRWTFLNGHTLPSTFHGWCSGSETWFSTLATGFRRQGADIDLDVPPGVFPNPVSGGLGHPNAAYHHDGLGPAIAEALDATIRQRLRPAAPGALRVVAQRAGGDIHLRWDDRATTETEYRVKIRLEPAVRNHRPAPDTQPSGEAVLRDRQGATEYTIAARGDARYTVEVRACHVGRGPGREECSDPATRVVANFKPEVVPEGLESHDERCLTQEFCLPSRMSWRPVDNTLGAHIYYEVEADGRRYATEGTFLDDVFADSFRVRSCNFIDCTAFSLPSAGPRLIDRASTGLASMCRGIQAGMPRVGEPSPNPSPGASCIERR